VVSGAAIAGEVHVQDDNTGVRRETVIQAAWISGLGVGLRFSQGLMESQRPEAGLMPMLCEARSRKILCYTEV